MDIRPTALRSVAVAAFAGMALTATPALAARDARPRGPAVERQAYDAGYQEGQRIGEDAARRRRSVDIEREPAYRDGDRGYSARMGNRDAYRRAYRDGFARGYADAWGRGADRGYDRDRDDRR